MAVVQAHIFHFIVDSEMKTQLKNTGLFCDSVSLSGRIVSILDMLMPVIGNEHKWGEQRMSRYMNVCDDPDEVREHVHVYFPPGLYRKLKLLHQDLNAYSIAQLLRGFLRFFLGLLDVHGEKVFQVLKKTFSRWKKDERDTRQTLRESVQQLLKIIRHLPRKNRHVTIYDGSSIPFWILRM
jgi:hypothetical protein